MKRSRILTPLGIFGLLVLASVAWASDLFQVPKDIEPPVYLSGGGPFLLEDGTPWAMQDGEWAAIPFIRTPDNLLATNPDFDLLSDSDPDVFSAPLQITGWVELTEDFAPVRWQARGTGALPIWFVRWSELQAAMADGDLTIGELASMESLLIGTATYYQEENHIYGVHPVSHLAVVASGTLEGGGTFDLKVIEVGLELKEVRIVFE